MKRYFTERDEIKDPQPPSCHANDGILAVHTGARRRVVLGRATWHKLMEHEAFQVLDFTQEVTRREGVTLRTTRCPIRIDGEIYKCPKGAPSLGQHTGAILAEFLQCDQEVVK